MSEERPRGETAKEKMRAVLEMARHALVTDSGLSAFCDDAPNEVFHLDNKNAIQQIDEVLAMKSSEPTGYDISQELEDMKQFILMQSGGHIKHQLLELPEQIKLQSSTVADLTADIEKLRLSIANSKNQALELVLSATEAGKPKYGNDKARNLAVEQILRGDKLYLDNIDELGRKESALRAEQIQLEYLHNMFRGYLATAGLQGVR